MREITAQAPGDRRGIDANGNPGIDQESSETAGKETLAHGLRARVVDALIRQFFSPRRRTPSGAAHGSVPPQRAAPRPRWRLCTRFDPTRLAPTNHRRRVCGGRAIC
uniref:Uncharacterized protein n=1 Tax=Triticum urartu TaxID=4572 RepID=A0A8R7UHC6_TRIUA